MKDLLISILLFFLVAIVIIAFVYVLFEIWLYLPIVIFGLIILSIWLYMFHDERMENKRKKERMRHERYK